VDIGEDGDTHLRRCRGDPPDPVSPLALLGAVTAAEAAVLLLRGRQAAIVPARVQPQAYFSADDVRRARAYRRPQLALTLLDSALAASLLARLARRPPRRWAE